MNQATPEQLLHEAEGLHRAGRIAEAAALYQRILRGNPRQFSALYALGRIYFDAQQFDQAQYLIGEALRIDSAFAEGHCILGVALWNLGRTADALASFDRAISLKADFTDAIANRGMLLLRENRFAEALPAFDRVLELDPNHAVTWNNRGTALASAKCYLDALTSYDKALSIWPEFGQAKANRDNLLKEVAKSTAGRVFADVLCAQGSALMEQQRYKDALACFDDALFVRADCAAAAVGREEAQRSLS